MPISFYSIYVLVPWSKHRFNHVSDETWRWSEHAIIIVSCVNPAKWVSPSAELNTVADIGLSQNDGLFGITVISFGWSFGDIILSEYEIIFSTIIGDAERIDPAGEFDISSENNPWVVFAIVGLSWSFRLVVLNEWCELSFDKVNLLLRLGHQVVVSFTVISPTEWVCPSRMFLSVGAVSFSCDNMVVELSIIWSNMPENSRANCGGSKGLNFSLDKSFIFWRILLKISVESRIFWFCCWLTITSVVSWVDGWVLSLEITLSLLVITSNSWWETVTFLKWVWDTVWIFIPVEHKWFNWGSTLYISDPKGTDIGNQSENSKWFHFIIR